MRPGPADAALETPLLQKLQGWGVVLVAFFVVWVPYTWLREPSENLKQEQELKTAAISRGERAVQLFSEENQLGVGCVRCHGPELRGGVIQAGAEYAYPPNLTNICAGPFGNPPHSAINSTEDIYQVIREGAERDAVVEHPLPGCARRSADQRPRELPGLDEFGERPFKDNVCLNPDASARALEENLTEQSEGAVVQEVKSCLGFPSSAAPCGRAPGSRSWASPCSSAASTCCSAPSSAGTWGSWCWSSAFSGWMVIQSSLWLFGFWSQGLETPTNLGPRGSEPAWVVLEASPGTTSDSYETFAEYPTGPWELPDESDPIQSADVQSSTGAVTAFLAEQLNEELGLAETDPTAIAGTQFSVDSVKFSEAEDGKTKLAVVRVALQRRWATVDRVAVLRLGQRAAILVHVPRGLDHRLRSVPAAARPRGEEAQGVPDRRGRARVVRTRVEREEATMIGAEIHPSPRSGERPVHPAGRDDPGDRLPDVDHDREVSAIEFGDGLAAPLHLRQRGFPLFVERQDLQLDRQVHLANRHAGRHGDAPQERSSGSIGSRHRPCDRRPPAPPPQASR